MSSREASAEEAQRLRELWSYDILDTDPDPKFDELVQLAARVCAVPAAAITLVDTGRLWFKAKVGIAVEELNREGSLCETVVLHRTPCVVTNAKEDLRFCENELVVGPMGLRAYLGYPIVSAAGAVLGSLCVLDVRVRDWSANDREAIRVLASQVAARLDLRRAQAELQQLWDERGEIESRLLGAHRSVDQGLAAELHDGLGQDLTGISLLLKTLRGISSEPHVQEELRLLEHLTRSAIQSCRRLARGQKEFAFIHGSLQQSLERYVAGVNEMAGVRCTLTMTPVSIRDRTVAYNLYRIAQEAVTNAVRHSRCGQIRVQLAMHSERLRLEIEDDGCGLRPEMENEGGIGFDTMRYRANALGGTLEFLPSATHGLLVRCELPLPRSVPVPARGPRRLRHTGV